MKVIKDTVEVVRGYEATDGTFFMSEEECKKYEKSALLAAKTAANYLKTKSLPADSALSEFMICCENEIAVFDIKNADDLQVVNTYLTMLYHGNDVIDPTYIGHKVALDFYCYDNNAYVLGTRAELEKDFQRCMNRLFGTPEEENAM